MSISLDEVKHIAKLARLELTAEELSAFQGELNALLGHFQDVNLVDVTGFLPKPHAVALQNIMSMDVVRHGLRREDALRNAPTSKAGLFVVPTIIED
ncbi:MAG: Asp-tRNA(Asn)/Glu-tRNA(Gln) amidotransferase subunit GatC [Armatimonadetes bacterium]|nr:Asp-tRNA(Asn)/Glu-tRNA(Gln) amidotransferase subunit GatC [Armatimonadota bacterium]